MHDRVEPTPLVAIEGVSRRFGSDPPVHALVDVTFEVHTGDWVAIVGPSGSGKSTLLNIVGCLDVQTAGSYRFDGLEVGDIGDDGRAALRSRGIGFVFQSFHLLSHRSVIENVMLAELYRRQRRRGRRDRAATALDRVGLGHRSEFLPTRLSGGESQRVAIARAIMGSPRLLLCDEPTGNLDSKTTAGILDLFAELNAGGATIIMITHERDVAERAGRTLHMTDGVLQESA